MLNETELSNVINAVSIAVIVFFGIELWYRCAIFYFKLRHRLMRKK